LYHQAKLSTAAKLAAIDRDYEHKQKLIEQAKAAYTKKNLPASAKSESGGCMFQALSLSIIRSAGYRWASLYAP
jgi:hypothetical protein